MSMKIITPILFIFSFLLVNSELNAALTKTVNLSTPGTLATFLTSNEKSMVTDLIVSGSMNTNDIAFINSLRDSLKNIDLGNATLVQSEGLAKSFAFAFGNNINLLESISLPAGILGIRDRAFTGCNGLKRMHLPSSVKEIGFEAFFECNSLQKINLPEGLTKVDDFAFLECRKLDSLVIPSTLDQWGWCVFGACTSLKSLTFAPSLKRTGDSSFRFCTSLDSIVLPTSLKVLEGGTFMGCSQLKSVVLNVGLDSLNMGAFAMCPCLEELLIPTSVQFFGGMAVDLTCQLSLVPGNNFLTFEDSVLFDKGKTKLINFRNMEVQSYIVPETVTSIEDLGFANAQNLAELQLPVGLHSIHQYAFAGCLGLTTLQLPISLQVIEPNAFNETVFSLSVEPSNPYLDIDQDVLFNKDRSVLIWYPVFKEGSYEVPETVDSIAPNAFQSCDGLTCVILPEKLRAIGKEAFSYYIDSIFVKSHDASFINKDFKGSVQATLFVPRGYLSEFVKVWGEYNIEEWDVPTSISRECSERSSFFIKDGKIILMKGNDEQELCLYSLNGKKVFSRSISGNTQIEIPIPYKGIWLLRVGNKSYKVIN